MNQFQEFDPTQGEQFEEFDVFSEVAPEAEATIESVGGLSDSADHVRSLLGARDELEKQLMLPMGVSEAAISAEEPYSSANVVGVGIGEKVINGVPTGQLAVKVLVKEKKPESRVASEALVPQSLGGVTTDVEETGEIRATMFTARRRPAPCGVSVGNCLSVSAGTLGCLVTRNNQLFILSNNHVLALVNTSPLNAAIAQPGRIDGGVCPQDIIARLTQFPWTSATRRSAVWRALFVSSASKEWAPFSATVAIRGRWSPHFRRTNRSACSSAATLQIT